MEHLGSKEGTGNPIQCPPYALLLSFPLFPSLTLSSLLPLIRGNCLLNYREEEKEAGGGIVCSGNGKKKPAFPFPPLLVLWVGGGAVYRADFGLLLWPGGLGFAKNPKNTIVDSLNATLITLFKNVQRRVFFAC